MDASWEKELMEGNRNCRGLAREKKGREVARQKWVPRTDNNGGKGLIKQKGKKDRNNRTTKTPTITGMVTKIRIF